MSGRARWGVIGAGGIAARRTIPEGILCAANAELVSVYGPHPGRTADVARKFGAKAARSIEELLSDRIDCVYIASPNDCHLRQAEACAAAGKHVLCEKPLGLSVEEARRMVTLFAERGLRLGAAFMMRFQSQHRAALDLIRAGRLGQPVYARAQLSCWYPPIADAWRQDAGRGGGGSLMDMGGHCLDLLEMFFGPIERVACLLANAVHGYAPEDGAVVSAAFENGALGTVDTFFSIPDESSENVLELYGSEASILARNTIGQGSAGTMRLIARGGAGSYNAQQDRTSAGEPIAPEPVNPYRAEIEEFGRAVLEGRPAPVSGEDGLRSQSLLAACYESARAGRPVGIAAR